MCCPVYFVALFIRGLQEKHKGVLKDIGMKDIVGDRVADRVCLTFFLQQVPVQSLHGYGNSPSRVVQTIPQSL